MATTLDQDSIYREFEGRIERSWEKPNWCQVHSPTERRCICDNGFYRIASIERWMTQTQENKEKINGLYLLERAIGERELRSDDPSFEEQPSTIFDGETKCIIAFTILLRRRKGYLVYDFQEHKLTDRFHEQANDEIFDEIRKHLQRRYPFSRDEANAIVNEFKQERWKYHLPCLTLRMNERFGESVRLPFHKIEGVETSGQGSILRVWVHEDFVGSDLQADLETYACTFGDVGKVSLIPSAFVVIYLTRSSATSWH